VPFILILIIIAIATESFATTWYSGAIHSKLKEKLPYMLPVGMTLIKSLVLAAGIYVGSFGSVALPMYYANMAYALMFIIGLKMIMQSMRFNPEERIVLVDDNKTLILVSIAGSFNSFFIGFSLGLIGISVLMPVAITFFATLIMSFAALFLGKQYGLRPFVRITGIVAGAIISIIALRYFILYLM
jgi:manganese efflux pump family protein